MNSFLSSSFHFFYFSLYLKEIKFKNVKKKKKEEEIGFVERWVIM